jgi:hypothetical protein
LPGARTAALNRLRWAWQTRLGWPGTVALLLLVAGAAVTFVLRPALAQARRDVLREHVARLDANARPIGARATPAIDPRDAWHAQLPPLDARGTAVATLLATARKAGVPIEQASYASDDVEPGLARLRVDVPLTLRYAQLRSLVAAELDALPNAALDALELEREGDGDAALRAQLTLSLYFRREAR